MSQTNWIGAFIAIGFIAYIIANGQLSGYLDVLGIKSQQTQNGQSTSESTTQQVIDAINKEFSPGIG